MHTLLLDHVSCLHMPVHWLNNFCLKLLILHLIWVNCSEVNSYSACFYILDITFQSPITHQPNSPMDGTLYIRTCWIMLSACTCWSTVLTISYLNDLWRSEQLHWLMQAYMLCCYFTQFKSPNETAEVSPSLSLPCSLPLPLNNSLWAGCLCWILMLVGLDTRACFIIFGSRLESSEHWCFTGTMLILLSLFLNLTCSVGARWPSFRT